MKRYSYWSGDGAGDEAVLELPDNSPYGPPEKITLKQDGTEMDFYLDGPAEEE